VSDWTHESITRASWQWDPSVIPTAEVVLARCRRHGGGEGRDPPRNGAKLLLKLRSVSGCLNLSADEGSAKSTESISRVSHP
jgi:hypothetical protein